MVNSILVQIYLTMGPLGTRTHPVVISHFQHAQVELAYTAAGKIPTWVGFWTEIQVYGPPEAWVLSTMPMP